MNRPTHPNHDSPSSGPSDDGPPTQKRRGGPRDEVDQAARASGGDENKNDATASESVAGSAALLGHIRGLEAELRRLEDDLDHSRRLATLGELAAAVAHELNNALTPMTSYAQLALDDPGDTDLTRKALSCVVEGVERASRMTRSMLGMVRDDDSAASNGNTEDTRAQVGCDLRKVVDASVDCLVGQPGRARVRVEVDVPDLAVQMPHADLQQVLVNLLLNAHRAVLSGRGTGRVTVGAKRVERKQAASHADRQGVKNDDAASSIELWVADNGPGVPARVRDRLFEAFVTCPVGVQSEEQGVSTTGATDSNPKNTESTAGLHGGTGLGLSICRDLVERAGGTIRVEDATGDAGGAAFRVLLPGWAK